MWNSSPHSAEETERIKGFQKDFYKCIDVSTRVGLEISRSVKHPELEDYRDAAANGPRRVFTKKD